MWYIAENNLDGPREYRVCYAESRDGVHWERPALGLIEYNGSTANNLVDLLGGASGIVALPMLYETDDPDPSRRYKVAFRVRAVRRAAVRCLQRRWPALDGVAE